MEYLEDRTIDKQTYKNRIKELDAEYDNLVLKSNQIDVILNDINISEFSIEAVYDRIKNFREVWKRG